MFKAWKFFALIVVVLDIYILNFWNMITNIVELISRLNDIVQKGSCICDGPMDPTFQMKHVPAL